MALLGQGFANIDAVKTDIYENGQTTPGTAFGGAPLCAFGHMPELSGYPCCLPGRGGRGIFGTPEGLCTKYVQMNETTRACPGGLDRKSKSAGERLAPNWFTKTENGQERHSQCLFDVALLSEWVPSPARLILSYS